MAYTVLLVPSVRRAADELTKAERRQYDAAVDALKGEGCKAGGKRLAASSGDDYPMCERGLYKAWRMFTVYREDGSIVIIAIDEHTHANNPTEVLAEIFPGLATTGRRRSKQPPCCEDPAEPPEMSAELRGVLDALFGL